jgi:hypothetical protein
MGGELGSLLAVITAGRNGYAEGLHLNSYELLHEKPGLYTCRPDGHS